MRKFCIFTLSLLLVFSSSNTIFASPQIQITNYPSSAIAGSEFNITFSATALDPNVNYYSKSLGGLEFYDSQTWSTKTSSWLSWNSSWSDLDEFTASAEASALGTLKTRFKSDTAAGNQQFKIRIRKVGTETNYDSESVTISVASPAPTATPTTTPTSTPIATKTPTPIPTATSTPKPTIKPSSTATPTAIPDTTPEVLAFSDEVTPTPEPETLSDDQPIVNKKNFPVVPIVLSASGLGLIGAAFYPLIKVRLRNG